MARRLLAECLAIQPVVRLYRLAQNAERDPKVSELEPWYSSTTKLLCQTILRRVRPLSRTPTPTPSSTLIPRTVCKSLHRLSSSVTTVTRSSTSCSFKMCGIFSKMFRSEKKQRKQKSAAFEKPLLVQSTLVVIESFPRKSRILRVLFSLVTSD